MKKLFVTMAVLLLLSGCNTPSTTSQAQSTQDSPAGSSQDNTQPQLTDLQRERYIDALSALNEQYALYSNWNGSPIPAPEGYQVACGFYIVEASPPEDGKVTVTVELYGNLYLNPDTMTDSIYDGEVHIQSQGLPHSPAIAFGRSVVEFNDSGSGSPVPLSCSYFPYDQPGIAYLKESSAQNDASDSPRVDISQYDPAFVRFIWKKLLPTRYIASPADITVADLTGYTQYLEIDWSALPADADSEHYFIDSSLLRLMPNLAGVTCYINLNDYSVFEGMNNLELLSLSNMNDARMATLRVGHTNRLHLDTPDCDLLDLANVNTDTLSLMSWSTAVGGFANCDSVKNLYINSTRTDMRLVNAEAFPNAEYLNLQFYSEMERVRDFSQLATFDDGVTIDLMLSYMACNDKTVATLAGVPLRLLVLSPNNGTGNRTVAPELVAAIPHEQLYEGEYPGDFSNYTKDTLLGN